MNEQKCDMTEECTQPVTHVGTKGWLYCETHARIRNTSGYELCRKLRPHELNKLRLNN